MVATVVPPSEFQNLLGGLFWPQGTPRKGKQIRLGLFEFAVVRNTESLEVYKGVWRLGSIRSLHEALNICSDAGLRPYWGLPGANSTLQKVF